MVTSALKQLLVSLSGRGIHVYVEDGKLKTRSGAGAITAEIAASIRENRAGLIELLSAAAPAADVRHESIARVPEADQYAPSFAQQRLWFLSHFESGSASYNMPMTLRLRGALDRPAMQGTLDEIVRRHSILRTTYRKTQAGVVQVINPAVPLPMEFVDLSAWTAERQAAEVARLSKVEATKPFDLSRDPMLRATLACLAPDCHVLYLTLHHIAADGWSLGILVKEFVALYEASRQRQASTLAPLEIQYVDFAHWQREHGKGERVERELSFWREALRGIPALHGLPLDKPRPLALDAGGGVVRRHLDANRLATLKGFANGRNASLFMVLQSAFALLVSRWSGERDIAIGTPVAGRVVPATEPLIGCFINTLVLRTTIREAMSYEELLQQSKATTLSAYAHQHVPFEMLVESLNPERSLSHTPLFQLMFALQNYEVGELRLPGLAIEEIANDDQNTKFDLAVMATERPEGLAMTWVFATSLFDEPTVASIASSFDVLLDEIVKRPDRDVSEMPLLTCADRSNVLALSRAGGQGWLVLDAHGAVQPQGALGQIYAPADSGEGEAAAVWQQLEARAMDARAVGLRATGAWGRLRASGRVELVANADQDVRLNGVRVDTRRIEEALAELDGVACAFVTVRPLSSGNTTSPAIVAYVARAGVPGDRTGVTLVERCREHVKARVPDFLAPRAIVVVDAMPMLADGRIDVEKLPEARAGQAKRADYAPPSHDLEAKLCEIWCATLSLPQVGIHDNFFEAGGTSLHSILLQQQIVEQTGFDVSVTDLFAYPTIADLARYLRGGQEPEAEPPGVRDGAGRDGDAIAVIGMAGRFPDAPNVDAFWKNIKNGVESLRVFTDAELREAGVDEHLLNRPDYVKSGVLLDAIEEFDAGYFGFTPREVEVTDPQQRLLFECAVEALEHAGYGDDARKRSVGVYVGVGESRYLFEHLLPQSALIEPMRLAALYGNRSDYAATRLSYRLNLTGPSIAIGTACSTSLVAVHYACTGLINDECEMALAGGAAIAQLGAQGYLYQEGSIASPDGHCRAFDAVAKGTRAGSGAGLVVLKRLRKAIEDGDAIHAVIKGSAINNDGADKVGYTAPSVFGQAQAIREAHRRAGVEPRSIQYVEAHGTATELGDPIEVKALTMAFGTHGAPFCGLGSVKANIGHLDAAAGVAGLIKTVKALGDGQIPPSINFHTPNPKIDFAQSPFYVNTQLRNWSTDGGPRRAGVSSFGIGGTNAHVVLEEAPAAGEHVSGRATQLIVLSAKTETALERVSANLLGYLKQHEAPNLADFAYTLQLGRARRAFRRAFVACSVPEAIDALEGKGGQQPLSAVRDDSNRSSIVFLFSGQGSQYVNMGRDLYESDPTFAAVVDRCADLLLVEFDLDLRGVLFPREDVGREEAERLLARTDIAQPALFVLEYALTSVLRRWGIEPEAMLGHSLGEYVAACLAGVFSLEDGLRLVARRGRLMRGVRVGRMLSVALGEEDAAPLFASAHCCLAAVNSANDCVASGPEDAIQRLVSMLEERGVPCRELRTSHAFHSTMMEEIAGSFRRIFDDVRLNAPNRRYVSNLTGDFIRPEQATDPEYWVRHLLGTVRYAAGVEILVRDATLRANRTYVEIGPGLTLSSLLRKHQGTRGQSIVATVRHAQEVRSDEHQLLRAVAQLWLDGATIDWSGFHEGERRRRVALPTYPFERQRFWIDKVDNTTQPAPSKNARASSPSEWFYVPTWKQLAARVGGSPTAAEDGNALWLVFCDERGIGREVCSLLESHGFEVVAIRPGESFQRLDPKTYVLEPGVESGYVRLLNAVGVAAARPVRIVHLWSVDSAGGEMEAHVRFDRDQALGFSSVLFLSRSLASASPTSPVVVDLVTNDAVSVTGEETIAAGPCTTLGLCKVIPQEFPQFRTYHLDVHNSAANRRLPSNERVATQLVAEATSGARALHVAYRGNRRWELRYERVEIEQRATPPSIKAGGNYVITGGLGKIGLLLAEHLAGQGAGGLLLISRSAIPCKERWPVLCEQDDGAETLEKITRLRQIESTGAKVRVCTGDIADYAQMSHAFDAFEREFGPIDGVIHCAGKVHDAVQAINDITRATWQEHFRAKAGGAQVLERVLEHRQFDFCVLMSSLSSVLGGLGFGAYASANSYLDAVAQRKHNDGDQRWLAVNWDGWIFTQQKPQPIQGADRAGMLPAEGVEAFDRVLALRGVAQLVNSTSAIDVRMEQWLHPRKPPTKLKTLHARPAVQTGYVEPSSVTERRLVAIWQDVLGVEEIGVRDNFFELGGDSLMLLQVHKAIRADIDPEVAVASLFQYAAIADLAQFLDKANGSAVAASIVNKRRDRRRAGSRTSTPTEEPA